MKVLLVDDIFDTGRNTVPSYTSTDTPIAIPDNNPTGASSTITVTDTNLVTDVNVTVNTLKGFPGTYTVTLTGVSSPTGFALTHSATATLTVNN
mgnify:CR=1 FL=1